MQGPLHPSPLISVPWESPADTRTTGTSMGSYSTGASIATACRSALSPGMCSKECAARLRWWWSAPRGVLLQVCGEGCVAAGVLKGPPERKGSTPATSSPKP